MDAESPSFDLTGKVAVIAGATGILGSRFSRELARRGATVVVSDLDRARCDTLCSEIAADSPAGTAVAAEVDLASEESVRRWARSILDEHGAPDVLVNNAAAKSPGIFAPLPDFALEDWNAVMDVNVTGMFLTLRELGPAMAAAGRGSIVNTGSIYGVVGPDQRIYEGSWYEELGGAINTPLVYSASKAAVVGITRYIATYWGPQGLRCNALIPGGVESGQNEEFVRRYSERVPMGRMATGRDICGALVFLASDASAYVNGQCLVVDGGWTAW